MGREKWVLNAILDPADDCHVRWEQTRVVKVAPYDTATIEINLSLSPGAGGSVVFKNQPLTWVDEPPDTWQITLATSGTLVTIVDPNQTPASSKVGYEFHLNWCYTSPDGTKVQGKSDPTIINEGTGVIPPALRAG